MLWRNYIKYKEMPELLRPTTIYARLIQYLLDEVPILGMAHITGGGIPENLPRCLPQGLTVEVDYGSWDVPEMFETIQLAGNISDDEMRSVFNMGIGFCLVVPKEVVELTQELISDTPFGMRSWVIGNVIEQ
jgi:phosphoribosylformylglycinamidine cyclo-ligase